MDGQSNIEIIQDLEHLLQDVQKRLLSLKLETSEQKNAVTEAQETLALYQNKYILNMRKSFEG